MRAETEVAERIRQDNLVFRLARASKIFVVDGRVYYADGDAEAGLDTFRDGGRIYDIKEGPLLEVLERMSDLKIDRIYSNYQEKFIAQELKDHTAKIGNHGGNHERLARFALQEIFPYLRKDSPNDLDRILETAPSEKLAGEKNCG